MKKNLFFLFLILIISAGCTHNVDVALRPDYGTKIISGEGLSRVTPQITFARGEFIDARPNPNVLAEFKQGMHTYYIREERPVDEAFYEGLEILVTSSGHYWDNRGEGDIKIDLEFKTCSASRATGFVTVSAQSSVEIFLEFVDTETGEVIYSDYYKGSDQRSQAMIGLIGMVKYSIDASIVRCVQNVGNDRSLAKVLKENFSDGK